MWCPGTSAQSAYLHATQIVAIHRTKLGPCDVMRQNPWNAVLCLGHGRD